MQHTLLNLNFRDKINKQALKLSNEIKQS